MFIKVDFRPLQNSIKRLTAQIRTPTVPYGRASRHMRDYVRQTITMQGRNRSYIPLSHWTKARTGKSKALLKLRPFIKAEHSSQGGIVFFEPPSPDWGIDQHHTGFVSRAVVNKKMVIPSRGGGILAVLMNRKESKIPAREVWPTKAEVEQEVQPIFKTWLDEVARKTWR